MKRVIIVAGLLSVSVFGHDIITTKLTYNRNIQPILQRRCSSCHSSDSSIALTSYDQVRPWAEAIKEQVLERSMPPWGAVKGFGDFEPDDGMPEDEILLVSAWVVGGAPQGNVADFIKQKPLITNSHDIGPLKDVTLVRTRVALSSPLTLAGIKPDPPSMVHSAQITATLPNGRIEPLLWLYGYNPKCRRIFRYRDPILLPAGTLIKSTATLRYYLESR